MMQNSRSFDASHTALTFPLGGIGTGNVSLGARGELRDWEIFNNSAKGNALPNAFFAIRTQAAGEEPQLRVLESRIAPPHNKSHGYHPAQNGGLPRFAKSTFTGEYPIANVLLEDGALPVRVELEAFTPLLPLNPEDSGIPGFFLDYAVTNIGDKALDVTLVGSLCNPVGGIQLDAFENIAASKEGKTLNVARDEETLQGIFFTVEELAGDALRYGSLALVTDHKQVTMKPRWLRAGWYDYLQEFWDDLANDGLLTPLDEVGPSPDGRPDTGSLGLVQKLAPGETYHFRFWLTWHFPNRRHTWKTEREIARALAAGEVDSWENATPKIRNHYATLFADAWAVARYMVTEWERLAQGTRDFVRALHGGTLPRAVLDAVSAGIVPLRTNTCFWLEDGRFYGWEGLFDTDGSCHGTCTHVWSYAYALAYLFPSLEREMRRIEFQIETEDGSEPDGEAGYMYFRNSRSMGESFKWDWGKQKPEAASDGQMGSILRAWREYQLSGDKQWLASLWEKIVLALDYARHWDSDGDFVLDGKQHNTYDIEFYGPNPLSSIYYLAGLRAVEEMALALGDDAVAARTHAAFEQGSRKLDELLWDGEYYVQRIEDVDAWRYQHGLGCLSDQLLGQLHAHALGLGDLLPAEHIRGAIKSVHTHNFKRDFTDHTNCQRTYVLNGEAGLLLCSFPKGGRPRFPFPYSDEVWTGVEYQVAAELIYTGWLDEGLEIVQAVQNRQDGRARSPWNEVECGHHYARSMASFAVLLALSGQQVDATTGAVTFDPKFDASSDPNRFETFWSNGREWGIYTQQRTDEGAPWRSEIEVLGVAPERMAQASSELELVPAD